MRTNYWSQFVDLLPKSPTVVGTVVDIAGELYTVQLLDGGLVRATSAALYTEGARVFVRQGVVLSEAPALTSVSIEL